MTSRLHDFKTVKLILSACCGGAVAFVATAEDLNVGAGEEMTLSATVAYSTITVNGRLTIDSAAQITADAVRVGWDGGTGVLDVTGGAKLTATELDIGSCTEGTENPVSGQGTVSLSGGATVEALVCFSRNCVKDGSTLDTAPTNTLYLGANATFTGQIEKYGDPPGRLAFAGGRFVVIPNGFFVRLQESGELFIDSIDGAPIELDCNNTHTTFPVFGSCSRDKSVQKVHFRGTGDFIRTGSPTDWDHPLHMLGYGRDVEGRDDWSGFMGRFVAQSGGVRWFQDQQGDRPDGLRAWVATNGGFFCVGPGWQAISSFSGDGYISTKETKSATLVANVADAQTWDVRSDIVDIRKMKGGDLTLPNATHGKITVGGGSVALAPQFRTAWKYYRFKVDRVSAYYDSVLQISELKLYDGEEDVTQKRSGLYSPDGRIDGEGATAAVDGSVDTKWCYNSTYDNYWLRIDFATPQTVTKYEWYTANDARIDENTSWREPVDWHFQGSMDGSDWVDLDAQKDFVATAQRKTLAYTGVCAAALPFESEADTVSALVSTGATLRLRAGRDFRPANVYNFGTVDYAAGVGMTCIGDGEVVNPQFAGTGDFVKTGADTVTTVLGANPFSGKVRAESGTLRLGGAGTTAKYWRLTVKNVEAGLDGIFQLDEVELLALDGTRVNAGLKDVGVVASAAVLQPGTAAFVEKHGYVGNPLETLVKLFDGNWTTKCCVPFRTKSDADDNKLNSVRHDDTNSWIRIVFRLADDAKPAVAYQFVSGTDAAGLRDPDVWTLESSPDGVTWTQHDAQEYARTPDSVNAIFNDGIPYPLKNCGGSVCEVLPNVTDVSIAPGAELALVPVGTTLGTLTIDCAAGAGTLRGFTPAPGGELHLVNVASAETLKTLEALPITLAETGNVRNLKTWRVFVNGTETELRVRADAQGRLVLRQSGFTIIFR